MKRTKLKQFQHRRRWWVLLIALLLASLVTELFIDRHPAFGIDGLFGFFAVYGFVSCIALIVASKILGHLVKRPDGYYES